MEGTPFVPGAAERVLRPLAAGVGVFLGLGRMVALYYRSSTSYQIRKHIRYLYF